MRPVDLARERGLPAVQRQAAVESDRLIRPGLGDREPDRFRPPAGALRPILVGDDTILDPHVPEDEGRDRAIARRPVLRLTGRCITATQVPVAPAVRIHLKVDLRLADHEAVELDATVAPVGEKVEARLQGADPGELRGRAPVGIGDAHVAGGDFQGRPGAEAERLAEAHRTAGGERGAALDRPFLQRRRHQQERGDQEKDDGQKAQDADEQLAHASPRGQRLPGVALPQPG